MTITCDAGQVSTTAMGEIFKLKVLALQNTIKESSDTLILWISRY